MRRYHLLFPLLFTIPIFAGTITINDDARGYINPGGPGGFGDPPPDNGTDPSNDYFAGLGNVALCIPCTSYRQFRDWFEFAIPSFTNTLESVVISLNQPAAGHIGSPTTYTLYGMPGMAGSFSDLIAGLEYGSVPLDSGSNGTTVQLTLNATAIQAIMDARGGAFFLSGVDSAENNMAGGGDFASSLRVPVTLTLDIADPTPEPSSFATVIALATLLLTRVRR